VYAKTTWSFSLCLGGFYYPFFLRPNAIQFFLAERWGLFFGGLGQAERMAASRQKGSNHLALISCKYVVKLTL
ncbi:MAG: hypothetical protein KDD14_26380, partial [Saprospiraceae bacterium]|nr:hypothetical protein [Saprospiraceae bacterium]